MHAIEQSQPWPELTDEQWETLKSGFVRGRSLEYEAWLDSLPTNEEELQQSAALEPLPF